MHTYIHTYINSYTYVHTYTYVRTYVHIHKIYILYIFIIYVCTYRYTYTYIHIIIHACVHTRTWKHTHSHTHTHACFPFCLLLKPLWLFITLILYLIFSPHGLITGDASAVPSRRKSVTEGYPAVLDCLTDTSLPSSGNIMFSWSRDGINIKDNPRLTVLASGALFVRSSLRSDSGVYTCTANTFDSSGLVTYPGAKILLDVQCKFF